MIFDECHHARKNNPYNGILREYHQLKPLEKRPKIFGMTASPIWNAKNPLGSLSELESNMDAKVIGVVEHVQELDEHAPKAKEVRSIFPAYLVFFSLWSADLRPTQSLLKNTHLPLKNTFTRHRQFTNALRSLMNLSGKILEFHGVRSITDTG